MRKKAASRFTARVSRHWSVGTSGIVPGGPCSCAPWRYGRQWARRRRSLKRLLHARLDRRLVTDVHAVDLRPPARGGPDLLARPGCRRVVDPVEEGDVGARFGQGLGDRPPDIARAARDERRLA